jgi:hypothetical protein
MMWDRCLMGDGKYPSALNARREGSLTRM